MKFSLFIVVAEALKEVPVDPSGKFYFADEIILPAFTIDIRNYGCHCSKLDPLNFHTGGKIVNELDRICRDWLLKRNCLWKKKGVCTEDAEWKEEDTYDHIGLVGSCTKYKENSCKSEICKIDEMFTWQIFKFLGKNGMPKDEDLFSNLECDSDFEFTVKDSCCGNQWENYEPFDSRSQMCVDDLVVIK